MLKANAQFGPFKISRSLRYEANLELTCVLSSSSDGSNELVVAWVIICREGNILNAHDVPHTPPKKKNDGQRPFTPRTRSDGQPFADARAPLTAGSNPPASHTQGLSEWPHEEERWLHVDMDERFWKFVPYIDRRVSHKEKGTSKTCLRFFAAKQIFTTKMQLALGTRLW